MQQIQALKRQNELNIEEVKRLEKAKLEAERKTAKNHKETMTVLDMEQETIL